VTTRRHARPGATDLEGLRAAIAALSPRPGGPTGTDRAAGDGGANGHDAVRELPGEPARAALAFILRSTQARPQTEAEIRAKLRRREVAPEDADAAVAEAKRIRAIDDAAFAAAWVEDRGRKRGMGAPRLRQELERRQVPDHVVDSALTALDDRDDLAAATALATARAATFPATLPPETAARRLTGYLARRGYTPAQAQRVAIEVSGLGRHWD
jgi:regulatory protein